MVDLIVDMDYGKCSYTRIFLVYAETSRSDSKGFQKIPKVYDYDYDHGWIYFSMTSMQIVDLDNENSYKITYIKYQDTDERKTALTS